MTAFFQGRIFFIEEKETSVVIRNQISRRLHILLPSITNAVLIVYTLEKIPVLRPLDFG